MDNTDAVKLLEDCEKGLRRMVRMAADTGDYAGIIKLTAWARVISGLVEDAKTGLAMPGNTSLHPGRRITTMVSKPSRGAKKSPAAASYPKFYRTSKDLIKIGWSKKERAEYQHKAPHTVLMQLVSKLAVVGAGGAVFSAEDLFPLEGSDGSTIPDYQSYLCLAWLRQEGLIEAHGRQGYSLAHEGGLAASVDARWSGLSFHRS